MLIRSQNKQGIYNMDVISAIDFADSSNSLTHQIYVLINGREYLLGRYSTKEKAIAVLDMIEKKYLEPSYINDVGGGEYAKYERSVFQMPEDNEVNYEY
jgi:hypothetical protein